MQCIITVYKSCFVTGSTKFLTIIPRARMGSKSIAHEAEGRHCLDFQSGRFSLLGGYNI